MDSLELRSTGGNSLSQPQPSLIAPYHRKRLSRFDERSSENRASSFATQYTGLILIVFTVIIGSLSAAQLEKQTRSETSKKPPPLGKVSLDRLFEESSSSPDPEQLAALKELLSRHDIHGKLILPFTKKSARVSFKRIIALRNQTKQLGIPSSYLAIELDEDHTKAPVLILEHAP
jgi:hypothetical protein